MRNVEDLVRLMRMMYERSLSKPSHHHEFYCDLITLETWRYDQGGFSTPPCEIFRISVFKDGLIKHGIHAYLTFWDPDPIVKIDALTFRYKRELYDRRLMGYRRSKYYKSSQSNEANNVPLTDYCRIKTSGGWDAILDCIAEFVR